MKDTRLHSDQGSAEQLLVQIQKIISNLELYTLNLVKMGFYNNITNKNYTHSKIRSVNLNYFKILELMTF